MRDKQLNRSIGATHPFPIPYVPECLHQCKSSCAFVEKQICQQPMSSISEILSFDPMITPLCTIKIQCRYRKYADFLVQDTETLFSSNFLHEGISPHRNQCHHNLKNVGSLPKNIDIPANASELYKTHNAQVYATSAPARGQRVATASIPIRPGPVNKVAAFPRSHTSSDVSGLGGMSLMSRSGASRVRTTSLMEILHNQEASPFILCSR